MLLITRGIEADELAAKGGSEQEIRKATILEIAGALGQSSEGGTEILDEGGCSVPQIDPVELAARADAVHDPVDKSHAVRCAGHTCSGNPATGTIGRHHRVQIGSIQLRNSPVLRGQINLVPGGRIPSPSEGIDGIRCEVIEVGVGRVEIGDRIVADQGRSPRRRVDLQDLSNFVVVGTAAIRWDRPIGKQTPI